MSVREYIGARYVPLFMGAWDNTVTYEPLSIVQYQGNSYTSRQYVPTGIEITNTVYWAETGSYNAQVEQYRREVLTFDDRITDNSEAISDVSQDLNIFKNTTNSTFNNIYNRLEDLQHGTVAEMVADSTIEANTFTMTRGFYSENDGGAATYLINDEGTANGFDTIALDNGLIAHLVINSVPNCRQFGAKGDNVADDTAALQAMLDYVGSGTIEILAGRYKTSQSLVMHAQQYLFSTTKNAAKFMTPLPAGTFTLANGAHFQSIDFETTTQQNVNSRDPNVALYGNNVTGIVIEGCDNLGGSFRHSTSRFLEIHGESSTILLTNCLIDYGGVYGWAIEFDMTQTTSSIDVILRDCFIDSWQATRINGGCFILRNGYTATIENCLIRGHGDLIRASGSTHSSRIELNNSTVSTTPSSDGARIKGDDASSYIFVNNCNLDFPYLDIEGKCIYRSDKTYLNDFTFPFLEDYIWFNKGNAAITHSKQYYTLNSDSSHSTTSPAIYVKPFTNDGTRKTFITELNLKMSLRAASSQKIGVCLYNNSNKVLVANCLEVYETEVRTNLLKWTNFNNREELIVDKLLVGSTVFMRIIIETDGGLRFNISPDGVNWNIQHYTTLASSGLDAITHVGFLIDNISTTNAACGCTVVTERLA